MKIHSWAIDRVKPYGTNPRRNEKAIPGVMVSLETFGWRQPLVVTPDGELVVGDTRWRAAKRLLDSGEAKRDYRRVPVHIADDLTDDEIRAYRIADNRTGEDADWDEALLVGELVKLQEANGQLLLPSTGFTGAELERMLRQELDGKAAEDYDPEPPAKPKSKRGEVYELGPHRLLCGDSTIPEQVAELLDGVQDAPLLHADPPYGMGKEGEGVENDNLYDAKLDAFQMKWWGAWRPFLALNASVYIWGNPVPLWRLWFLHLEPSEELSFRNEIVWDKGAGFGQLSEGQRSYSVNTERVLFFMLGRQFFGNVNQDDFFEGYEATRAHLAGECEKMGWGSVEVKQLTGVGMYGHWFSRSQWHMIPRAHYETLQAAADGAAFVEPYDSVKAGHLQARDGGGHLDVVHSFNEQRAYFDNTHDNMNEVWPFARVHGEDRHGHPTPKPVAVCARMISSSCPPGGVVLEPFGGSGSTLVAAESVGRECRLAELDPGHCDVIRRRYAEYVGDSSLAP